MGYLKFEKSATAIVGLIYETLLDEEASAELLIRVRDLFGGSNATLFLAAPGNEPQVFSALTPPEMQDRYVELVNTDPWVLEGTRRNVNGVVEGSDLVPQRVYKKSRIYAEFNHPSDIEHVAVSAVVSDHQLKAYLNVGKSMKAGGFGREEIEFIGELHPHVVRAEQLYRKYSESCRIRRELRSNFHWNQLNPTETRLVTDLIAGLSLKQHAHSRSRSIHTVRSQLKTVFRKLAVRSQKDLIALLLK